MAGVTGVDRIGARLARLGRGVRARVGRALQQAGALVAEEARARLAAESPDAAAEAAIAVIRRGDQAAEVVVTLPGAEAREFGTSRSAAKPFLRPAVEAKRAEASGLVARAVRSTPSTQETE
ncbi:HK97-gp10 family putative phage morphogenesis protein [Inquilinus sp. CA228]|uniref:HK97-gp10 family putative phage morphogenesis protein n=1 Tax=Inquilinus sp. CA228 TaxID=3455609 RepID=UPI003F8D0B9E